MKHSMKITLLLVLIFLLSQFVGIIILNNYCHASTDSSGCRPLPFGMARLEMSEVSKLFMPAVDKMMPFVSNSETKQGASVSIYIVAMIIFGTIIMIILIKFRQKNISRIWFALAIFIGLCIALTAFVSEKIALGLAAIIVVWKVFKPNVYMSNFGEIFIYGGIASLFYLMLNLFSASIILILISIYDMIAVWKIKHMITLANFQTENKIFAGAMIQYNDTGNNKRSHFANSKVEASKIMSSNANKNKSKKNEMKKNNSSGTRSAILGGGDMAFPIFFSGAVLKQFGFGLTLIIPIFSGIALFLLFYYAKKGKFYPAMPFISAGCFTGLLVVWTVSML